MLLTTSLPLLPPPLASLLPPLPNAATEISANQHAGQHQHSSRRPRPHSSALNRNSTLAALTSDERTITQRKMAIAMYGYSWLKPAGCAKTMLGRREEEVEREEVERQLREVELQERMQQEADEQDRLARLGETGEPEVDRDLDEDIPDADAEEGEDLDEDDSEGFPEEYEDDEMEGDLDDEIPDADEEDEDEMMTPDPDAIDANWVYDSRREPDSDEDEDEGSVPPSHSGHLIPHATVAGVRIPVPGSEYDYDEHEAEDVANAMLDEDEIFDDHDATGGIRDLDDDVPDAESDQAWEHTDTELEESEMDISIFPTQDQGRVSQAQIGRPSLGQGRRSSGRVANGSALRSSGPWIADPSPQTQEQTRGHAPHIPTPDITNAMPLTRNVLQHQYIQTPAMLDSPLYADTELDTDPFSPPPPPPPPSSSTNHIPNVSNVGRSRARAASIAEPSAVENTTAPANTRRNATGNASPARAARNWLDGAAAAVGGSARRTLFGRSMRRDNASSSTANTATAMTTSMSTSSGGLFSPAPDNDAGVGSSAVVVGVGAGTTDWDTPVTGQDGTASRTRSGRFLGAGRRRAD